VRTPTTASSDASAAKRRACDEVDRLGELLVHASHQIHGHPELCYAEHHAHDLLCSILEEHGIGVERGAFGLPTAFAARVGTGGPNVAVLCEYDALPGIGHACGHNIIAAAGLGAGLAAAALADELGGTVTILGTPAEEGGGGKIAMIDAGAFDDVDAAMMIHPAGAELRRFNAIAIQQLRVRYHGRSAHAAAAPHDGRNALDAAVLGYVNVAALRQHIRPDERIHGIFTEAGEKPNVVPSTAAAEWYVRSPSLTSLEPLKDRVLACLQAGAEAAGCTMELEWVGAPYADMVDNEPLLRLYEANARVVGRSPAEPSGATAVIGSTDMGNVSYRVPSIHPMVQAAPPGTAIHTVEFESHAAGQLGDRAVLDAAKVMAMTVLDLWTDPDALRAITTAHAESPAAG
jgi:amidohydrolase